LKEKYYKKNINFSYIVTDLKMKKLIKKVEERLMIQAGQLLLGFLQRE